MVTAFFATSAASVLFGKWAGDRAVVEPIILARGKWFLIGIV